MYKSNKYYEYDDLYKLLIIGNSAVGKSCMLMRFSENQFTENFYNTVGVDFKLKEIELKGKTVRLQIWDTAGQDKFRTITTSYYKGAHGIMIVYDITDRQSFENVSEWMEEIENYAQKNVNILLIGNKNDLQSDRKISFKEGQKLADQYKIRFIETSAKEALNITLAFRTLALDVMAKFEAGELDGNITGQHISKTQKNRNNDTDKKKKGCC